VIMVFLPLVVPVGVGVGTAHLGTVGHIIDVQLDDLDLNIMLRSHPDLLLGISNTLDIYRLELIDIRYIDR